MADKTTSPYFKRLVGLQNANLPQKSILHKALENDNLDHANFLVKTLLTNLRTEAEANGGIHINGYSCSILNIKDSTIPLGKPPLTKMVFVTNLITLGENPLQTMNSVIEQLINPKDDIPHKIMPENPEYTRPEHALLAFASKTTKDIQEHLRKIVATITFAEDPEFPQTDEEQNEQIAQVMQDFNLFLLQSMAKIMLKFAKEGASEVALPDVITLLNPVTENVAENVKLQPKAVLEKIAPTLGIEVPDMWLHFNQRLAVASRTKSALKKSLTEIIENNLPLLDPEFLKTPEGRAFASGEEIPAHEMEGGTAAAAAGLETPEEWHEAEGGAAAAPSSQPAHPEAKGGDKPRGGR